jgi:hypothetical protein
MKRMLLLVLVSVGPAHAEIVTVPFSATVTRADGNPFGIQAVPFETIVTGSFMYDTSTTPLQAAGNSARFSGSSFVMNIAGASVTGSAPFILVSNNSPNDTIGANAGRYFFYSSPLAVNGMRVDGRAEMNAVERGNTLFSSNDDLRMLPSQNRVNQLNFHYWGFIQDDRDGSFIGFQSVPEPCALLLVVQSLCMLGQSRRLRSGYDGRVV